MQSSNDVMDFAVSPDIEYKEKPTNCSTITSILWFLHYKSLYVEFFASGAITALNASNKSFSQLCERYTESMSAAIIIAARMIISIESTPLFLQCEYMRKTDVMSLRIVLYTKVLFDLTHTSWIHAYKKTRSVVYSAITFYRLHFLPGTTYHWFIKCETNRCTKTFHFSQFKLFECDSSWWYNNKNF